jgi:spore coat protein U-like protein
MKHCLTYWGWRRMLWLLLWCGCGAAGATCSVDTTPVAFGPYDPLAGQDLSGVGSITVSCAPAGSYRIALSAGGGSYASRTLTAGLSQLAYNLYTDLSHSMVWGDGSAATVMVDGMAGAQLHTVYGHIPGGQHQARAGAYADVIVVTVEF